MMATNSMIANIRYMVSKSASAIILADKSEVEVSYNFFAYVSLPLIESSHHSLGISEFKDKHGISSI